MTEKRLISLFQFVTHQFLACDFDQKFEKCENLLYFDNFIPLIGAQNTSFWRPPKGENALKMLYLWPLGDLFEVALTFL